MLDFVLEKAPPHLSLVGKVEALPIVERLPQQLARQLEDLKQLGVAERGGDFPTE